MAFIQVIEFRTSKWDEVQALDRKWEADTEGKRTLRRSIVCRDRNEPNRHLVLAFFDSAEAAQVNSDLPETAEFAKRTGELIDGPMEFWDLDVIAERT
jgi:quinol monooxygenase YgiN